jgi:pyridoxamine 5'-phosphate oxidase
MTTSHPPQGTPRPDPAAQPLREWLRTLPMSPTGLPTFGSAPLPAEPRDLFVTWLREVVAAGQLAARVMTLATSQPPGDDETNGIGGRPGARSVLLTDSDERGWQFATHASSPKGRALAAHPFAAATFFWPSLGRQVRLSGPVRRLQTDAAASDFLERSATARASILIGRQSEVLDRHEDYQAAFDDALSRLTHEPDLVDEDWGVYALDPDRVEFWQGSTTGPQVRVIYERVGESWTTSRLYP